MFLKKHIVQSSNVIADGASIEHFWLSFFGPPGFKQKCQRLSPIHSKLEMLMYTFQDLNKTVEFLSAKYDNLLLQFRSINDKIQRCNQDIASIKKYLNDVNTCAVNAI